MKILFISHYSDLYGANKSLIDLLQGLRKDSSYKIDILIPRHGKLWEYCKSEGFRIHIRKFEAGFASRHEKGIMRFIRRLTHLPRVLNLVRSLNPDLIYSNSSVIDVGIISSIVFRKKHIWHIREYGDLDYNIYYDLGKQVFKLLLRLSSRVIFISESLRNHIRCSHKSSAVVYNGVVTRSNLGKPRSNNKKSSIKLGIVGLITPSKGHLEAIKALALLEKYGSHFELDIYGDGDPVYISDLKAYIKELNLEKKVKFRGYVDGTGFFSNVDILLMCSENEAMGRVTVEAMAHGVPVIGRNSGATPELIHNGINGLLYFPDASDLATQVLTLSTNEKLYRDLSSKGIETVRENFTIEDYANKVNKEIIISF